MKKICAWCDGVLYEGHGEEISHGMCYECADGTLRRTSNKEAIFIPKKMEGERTMGIMRVDDGMETECVSMMYTFIETVKKFARSSGVNEADSSILMGSIIDIVKSSYDQGYRAGLKTGSHGKCRCKENGRKLKKWKDYE